MKKEELLQNILAILYRFKNNEERLQEIYNFVSELVKEEERESIEIPEQFRLLVKNTADSIGIGQVCYIHPSTLETVEIPKELLEGSFWGSDESIWESELDKTSRWESKITVEPLQPQESYRIMELFTDNLSDPELQSKLHTALGQKKPFSHFKSLVDHSPFRQDWFSFKQEYLERYVAEIFTTNKLF
jgi:hypothetical protein